MLYNHFKNNIPIRSVLLAIFYLCIAWLAYIFAIHGVKGLEISQSFINITSVLGFSESITRTLVVLVGVIDIAVAALLLLHPRWWSLAWAAAWPWVPFILIQIAGGSTHTAEFAITSLAALIAIGILPSFTAVSFLKSKLSL
jgi:hypothetical protein